MKKSILVMVLVLAILVSLVGCGGGNTMPTDPTENSQSTTPTEDNSSVTTPSEDTTVPSDSTDPTNGTQSTEGSESTNPTEGTMPNLGSKPTEGTQPTDTPDSKDYVLEITKNLNLTVGEVSQITVTYTGSKTLTWKTSDSSKATVTNGKVTAKAEGTVTISVTDGEKWAHCTVKVSDYTLKISRSTLSLDVGQVGNLTCEYTGTGKLTWESSDTSKATVSNGKVTAKAAGTVVITVKDGIKKSQCMVTITKPTAETPKEVTLKLNKSTLSMKVGESYTLSATYTGDKSLTWSSTNSSFASVSNGKVTAKSAGTVTIEVTDGVKKAQCQVVVTNAESPKEVILRLHKSSATLDVGKSITLTYDYTGSGTIKWNSSDNSVATVSGGTVTAKAAGRAVISITDGTRTAQCVVTVNAPANTPTATLTINTKNNTTITVGDSLRLDYTYTGNKSLTWTSNNTSKLTVTQSGVVTGVSAGSTFIKVTDGDVTARITIVVEEKDTRPLATSLVEGSHNAPLYDGVTKYAGDSMTFNVYAMPEEANRLVTVSSNNSSVVSVSYKADSRNITQVTLNFNSAGTATITIKSADGAKSKSYTITVKGDYSCNPGGGQLTPEQFVNAYNGVVKANGMSTSGMPSGYLMWTLSPSELTWAKARSNAEIRFHAWWAIGYRTIVLTYEETTADGNYVFYIRGY